MLDSLKPKHIANRIILLVLILELISMTLWGLLTYSASEKEILNSINNRLNESAYRTSAEIGNFYTHMESEIHALANFITTSTITNEDIKAVLSRLMKENREIDETSLIDKDNLEVIRTARMSALTKDDLRNFKGSLLISKAHTDGSSTSNIFFSNYFEPQINLATLIKGRDEVILSKINLKWLWDKVNDLTIGESGYVYLIDGQMNMVAHPDNSYVLANLNIRDTGIPRELFIVDNNSRLITYKNFSGIDVAGISYYDQSLKWWIIVEQPVSEGLAPLDRLVKTFIITFFIVAFLSTMIVVYFTRTTMRPLATLSDSITKLAHGNKNVRMEIPDSTELMMLSNSFNHMAQSLDENIDELEYRAHHDALTGLPNRILLHKELDDAYALPPPANRFSLLLIDLDRFKEINDSIGHKAGDELLKQLGPRLQNLLTANDMVARLGGDEFAILVRTHIKSDTIIRLAKSILHTIRQPFDLEELQVLIDASIGIALSPQHASDSSALLRFADVAMYNAKARDVGYAIYDSNQDLHSPGRLALMGELQNAIDTDQLVLYYQPKINLIEQRVSGFEALIRWSHPKQGLLFPDKFIPLAELGLMIKPLTYWVIDQALRDCREWRNNDCEADVSINISVRNLLHKDLFRKIEESLTRNNIEAHHLHLEITESAIMTDPKRAKEALDALTNLGVRLTIDDFGRGYSSLSYLKELPISEIKIDKSFIKNMTDDENDAVIVRSTIDMTHNLGLAVVAEGVETKDSLDLLERFGCDNAQGYYICHPLPVSEAITWSKNREIKSAS